MLNNLAKHLADKLLLIGSITKDERELYIYGFFMLLSNLMYLILACFFGLILGCLVESIIFYIAFQLIRRYAGGYHASTETRCEILSTFFIVVCIVTIKLADLHGFQNILKTMEICQLDCDNTYDYKKSRQNLASRFRRRVISTGISPNQLKCDIENNALY